MQFSDALEVAIGLTFMFLLVSLALTAIVEFISSTFKIRSVELHRGVVELLNDPGSHPAEPTRSGEDATRAVFSHPLVQGLYIGDYDTALRNKTLPSYLPARNFALALIDQVLDGRVNPPRSTSQKQDNQTASASNQVNLPAHAPLGDRLWLAAERVENEQVRRALLQAVQIGGNDAHRIVAHLGSWFDAAMDRVTGRFRRRSQRWLFGLGLLSAIVLNVNTLTVADALSQDATLRRAVVAQAEAHVAAPDHADGKQQALQSSVDEIRNTGLPIGWTTHAKESLLRPFDGKPLSMLLGTLQIALGYLVTALATTLGAPFWFEMLNRLLTVKAAIKAPDHVDRPPPQDAPPPGSPPPTGGGASADDSAPPPDSGRIDDEIYAEAPAAHEKLFEEWH